jgi:hypothetical protein
MGGFVELPGAGGTGRPGGHATDNHQVFSVREIHTVGTIEHRIGEKLQKKGLSKKACSDSDHEASKLTC